MRCKLGKTTVSFGFSEAAAIAVLLYLGKGRTLLIALCSALLHEAGHLLAIRLCGDSAKRLQFSLTGGDILPAASTLSYKKDMFTAAAGPAISAAAAAVFFLLWARLQNQIFRELFLTNAVFAAVNLLPARPLDGERLLRAFLLQHEIPDTEKRLQNAGAVTVLLLEILYACIAAYDGVNPSVAIFAGVVLVNSDLSALPTNQNLMNDE